MKHVFVLNGLGIVYQAHGPLMPSLYLTPFNHAVWLAHRTPPAPQTQHARMTKLLTLPAHGTWPTPERAAST